MCPRKTVLQYSHPTLVSMLVMALAIASLIPQTCIMEYHQLLIDGSHSSLNDVPSDEALKHAAELAPLYMGPLSSVSTSITGTKDIGLQAQIENGFPIEPVSNVLPTKLFLVYGLESSGTTFTAKTIAEALGVPREECNTDRISARGGRVQVHHISLPLGWVDENRYGFDTRWSQPLPTVPVFYPIECDVKPISEEAPPAFMPSPEACKDFMGDEVMSSPHRFFVNVTSNIQWYRERGVHVYPVMVIRDPMLHFQGIVKSNGGHCPEAEAAYQQYEQGRAIMMETIEKGMNPLIVSYESMLTLQSPYLKEIFRKLGIKSRFNNPGIRNGNTKYVSDDLDTSLYSVEAELIKEDSLAPERAFFPADQQAELMKHPFKSPHEDTPPSQGTTNHDPQEQSVPRLVFDPVNRVFKVDYSKVHQQSLAKIDDGSQEPSSEHSQTHDGSLRLSGDAQQATPLRTTNRDPERPAPRLVFDPVQKVFKVDYGEVHN